MKRIQVGKPKSLKEIDKQYQFVKLCSSLTKQGIRFTRYKSENKDVSYTFFLIINPIDFERVMHHNAKLPFVDSISIIVNHKTKVFCAFNQWADRKIN